MANNALYVSIYREILRDIQNGKYMENEPLPSEESLCRIYNVSRTTVHKALNMLKDTDAVYSVQGNGVYVKPHMFAQPLSSFYSFTDTLKSINILIQNEIIRCELIQADRSLASATGFPIGTAFHKLIRLRSAKEYPLMIETTYLPQSRFMSLDTEILSNSSLYDFLRARYGFRADRVTETFRPVFPRPEERKLLCITANTPCMLLERFSYEDSRLIEYTKSVVRGDKYTFQVELKNEPPHAEVSHK